MKRGDVVISRRGSDAGRAYVVLETSGENYVLVSDGRRHKLSGPKKKNVKHVSPAGASVEIPASDAELARIIESLNLSEKP